MGWPGLYLRANNYSPFRYLIVSFARKTVQISRNSTNHSVVSTNQNVKCTNQIVVYIFHSDNFKMDWGVSLFEDREKTVSYLETETIYT